MKEIQYYDLTNPQKAIFMSEQFYNDPFIYIIPAWAEIREEKINYNALNTAVNTVIKNHDSNRTRFIKKNDKIFQYFEEYTPLEIQKITVNNINELEHFIKNITFDIYSASPIKFFMYDNLSGFGGVCCVIHHLIGDAWSLSVVLEEILKCYDNILHPNDNYVPRISSYEEYIASENDYMNSSKFAQDKIFWEDKYQAPSEMISFKDSKDLFETESKRMSYYLSNDLKNFCNKNKISVFSFFYAIISIYFSRITNSNEITIGTPYLNRTNWKEKNCVGLFVSTLPFRQSIQPDTSIGEYIKKITISQLGILRHQRYPYVELQKFYTARFERSNNLYDILLSYQNAKVDNANLSFDFASNWVFSGHQIESLAISISDIDAKGSLRIDYDFILKSFSEDDIKKIHERLLHIAKQIINNKDILLKDIDIVTPEEQNLLLFKFNDTETEYSQEATIVSLFLDAANKNPHNIAVSFNGQSLTYDELDKKSSYLAHIMQKYNLKRNTFVGILMNRSIEMIVSMLAVLKCGAAYVPINPDYPKDRIDYMISDSNCSLVLLTEDLEYQNPDVGKLIVKIDSSASSTASSNVELTNIAMPDDFAYIIYTSGSTGKPKGVTIKHRNIVNTLLWRKKVYHFDESYSVLQIPSFAFDSSVEDIFTPLISGGKLVLINQSNSRFDIALIKQLAKTESVNHMLVVPSFYNVLLNEIPHSLENFKIITVAGESFSKELVNKHFKLLPNVKLYNEYGPTENSVCTSWYELLPEDDDVYIGVPINNCKCYILNSNLKLQPFNVWGELYVSGLGLSTGYVGLPELTKERFVKNPFSFNNPQYSLMYKTGDIVSINENGIMKFHERVDYQVKYNGFRINLGEIENKISACIKNPNVIVLLNTDGDHSKLCAYIETTENFDVLDIKQELKKFLPHYMLPKEIHLLKKFPLTPNAKVDRAALKSIKLTPTASAIVSPRNALDSEILSAWRSVLKIENISIDDNIFEIGGDSLSIISIQSRLFKNNINVNAQALFENPTIRSLSDYITMHVEQTHTENSQIYSPCRTSLDDIKDINKSPKSILLTGSTGFLGAHVLAELLNQYSDATIYCLVRNKPGKNNLERLQEILHFYFKNTYDHLINKRIIPVEGDLTKDHLAITSNVYNDLTTKIDTIINCASLVKHFGDYKLFYDSNVLSTKNIIKFAKDAGATIHHISTTSVSGNYLVNNSIKYDYTENDFYIGQNYEDNVYVRTKFEAENEIYKAQTEGVVANVYRVGNLTQRYSDGVFQLNRSDNAYLKRMYGFIQLRKIPEILISQKLEFTPVDYCAKAIISLLKYKNKVFHLLNPNTVDLTTFIKEVSVFGIDVDFIPQSEFNNFIHSNEAGAYLENFVTDFSYSTDLSYTSQITINDSITEAYLHQNEFVWPVISDNYIKNYIKNLLEEIHDQK